MKATHKFITQSFNDIINQLHSVILYSLKIEKFNRNTHFYF